MGRTLTILHKGRTSPLAPGSIDITVLAGPVLVPVLAAGHIAMAWRRGGER